VVTEGSGKDEPGLRLTAQSLRAQSFGDWSWKIVSQEPVTVPTDDPRIETVGAPTRVAGLAKAVANADFVAIVNEGSQLRETTLEKWLWFLATHPSNPGVTGSNPDAGARLYRRRALDDAGGIDAAWAAAAPLGRVPYTGALGADEEPHDPARAPEAAEPRTWIPESWPFRNVRPFVERRLLLIAPWMALGGADRVNLDILSGLRGTGWAVTVVTTRIADHSLYPYFERITTDLFPLADIVAIHDYPRFLDYLLDSRRPEVVVISQSEFGYRILPFLRARHPRPAFVDLCHSEVEDWYDGGFPRFSVEYQSLLDRTMTVSDHLRDWMVVRGGDPARIAVCHAGVDESVFKPHSTTAREGVRRSLSIAEDESLVLWVGRMSEEKQPQLLPRISAALRRDRLRHTLLIIGDGPERGATESLSEAEKTGRIIFLGEVEHSALPALYAAGDALVLPSRIEGIALTAYEAMASGIPVVVAQIGGQAELVTPDVGVLVAPDVEGLADRYAKALALVLRDPTRNAAMRRAARERIERHFTRGAMQHRILEILDEAVAQHGNSPREVFDRVPARALASEAVELILRSQVQALGPQPSRHVRAYEAGKRLGGSAYRWADAHHVPGLKLLRNAAHRAIVGR
jgi:glycosyltransferase involved in cell wall biosynthesis